jgi:hypothetical protein
MNCADDVNEANDSSSDGEDVKKQAALKAHYESVANDSKVATQREVVSSRLGSGRPSSSGVSSDEPLRTDNQQPLSNALPEDQEIVEVT